MPPTTRRSPAKPSFGLLSVLVEFLVELVHLVA